MGSNDITCAICGAEVLDWIGNHLDKDHGYTVPQYQKEYPTAPLISGRVGARIATAPKRRHPPKVQDLKVTFAGLDFPVHAGVPPEACLPEPDNYQIPRHGELGRDVAFALVGLQKCRSMYIWGDPGTGKDALIHYWSARTRTPGIFKQVIPGTDIEAWFFSRAFNEKGTFWEDGDLLRALRDGYLCDDGERVAYVVLLTDMDRAQQDQAEHIRLATDSISGRVQGAAGQVHKVFPGTRIIATANTSGGGDTTGRMVSSKVLDGSLMNRFNYKLMFHPMEWVDEEPIARAKFPQLVTRVPQIFTALGQITVAVRAAIAGRTLYGEFSHRDVCHILMAADDLLDVSGSEKAKANLLKQAVRVWLDGLPDEDTRSFAVSILDSHIRGGMVVAGKPPISGDPLADI